jgi:hypothetical protein
MLNRADLNVWRVTWTEFCRLMDDLSPKASALEDNVCNVNFRK